MPTTSAFPPSAEDFLAGRSSDRPVRGHRLRTASRGSAASAATEHHLDEVKRTTARGAEQKAYPSDLSDTEWERVRCFLPVEGRIGRRRQDMRRVLDGILYVVERGGRWRAMPEEFPAWQTCYRWRRRLRDQGAWPDLIAAIGRRDRLEAPQP